MKIVGVDPGNEVSHVVSWDGERVLENLSLINDEMRHYLMMFEGVVAIEDITPSKPRMIDPKAKADGTKPEKIAAPMPKSVIDTAKWAGVFWECSKHNTRHYITRLTVKKQICQYGLAKDPDIRRKIIDRYGEPMEWIEQLDGDGNPIVKKSGPEKGQPKLIHVHNKIYGSLVKDQWQAFAVALTAWETIVYPEMSYLKRAK